MVVAAAEVTVYFFIGHIPHYTNRVQSYDFLLKYANKTCKIGKKAVLLHVNLKITNKFCLS